MKRILFSFLLLLTFTACSNKKQAAAPKEETAQSDTAATDSAANDSVSDAAPVDAMTAATSKPNEVLFNGTIALSPQKQATVSMTMGGVVKTTRLLPGQFVRRNAVLATIENPEFITLQQDYLDCHAQIEYLKAEYDRQKLLSSAQAASQKKYQQSKADYLSMRSKLQATATQLSLLGVSPATLLNRGIQPLLKVTAPIGGYVSNVSMNIGKYIHSGDPLCEIIDKSAPLLRIITYEKDIASLKVGSRLEFRVNGMGTRTYDATVISIGQQVDQVNRSLEVFARIKNNNSQFRPGMYITARLLK